MTFHPRIHPTHLSLLRDLPADHPAVRALQVHAEAREICVGKEVDWPRLGISGIDQTWFSHVDFREWRFSAFAYQFISYDLFLDGWVESAPEATEAELSFLEEVPTMRALLQECESAARISNHSEIFPLVLKAKEFVDALEGAIIYRLDRLGISH